MSGIAERKECRFGSIGGRKRQALRIGRIFDNRMADEKFVVRLARGGLDDVRLTDTRPASDEHGKALRNVDLQQVRQLGWGNTHEAPYGKMPRQGTPGGTYPSGAIECAATRRVDAFRTR